MKRFHSNVSAAQGSLQETPEILDALSVNLAAHVLVNVIHGCVDVFLRGQIVVAGIAVSVDSRAAFDLAQDRVFEESRVSRWGSRGTHLRDSRSSIPMTMVF